MVLCSTRGGKDSSTIKYRFGSALLALMIESVSWSTSPNLPSISLILATPCQLVFDEINYTIPSYTMIPVAAAIDLAFLLLTHV